MHLLNEDSKEKLTVFLTKKSHKVTKQYLDFEKDIFSGLLQQRIELFK